MTSSATAQAAAKSTVSWNYSDLLYIRRGEGDSVEILDLTSCFAMDGIYQVTCARLIRSALN